MDLTIIYKLFFGFFYFSSSTLSEDLVNDSVTTDSTDSTTTDWIQPNISDIDNLTTTTTTTTTRISTTKNSTVTHSIQPNISDIDNLTTTATTSISTTKNSTITHSIQPNISDIDNLTTTATTSISTTKNSTTTHSIQPSISDVDILTTTNTTSISTTENSTTTDSIQPSISDVDNLTTTTSTSTTENYLPDCFMPESTNDIKTLSIECQPCICDKRNDSCQINCCCDAQCSEDDKEAFSKCLNFELVLNRRNCFRSNIFFAVNINYTVVHTSDGFYCVHSANETQRCYAKFLPLNDDTAFQKLGHSVDRTSRAIDFDFSYIDGKWQAGKPIIAVTENMNYFLLGLPQESNKWCHSSKTFLYLLDSEDHCQNSVYSSQECSENVYLNAVTFYRNFKILQNTTITVPVQSYLCNSTLENCLEEDDISLTYFDNKSQTCENVITHVQYTFTHRGIYGITKAEVKLVIEQKKLLETFDQKLELVYRWDENYSRDGNETNKTAKVSGNPGYLLKSPVLAGNSVNDSIELNSSGHLIFPSQHNSTYCAMSQIIKFGENVAIGCVIPISATNLEQMCDALRRETTEIMFLTVDRIGSFGNSTPTDLENWVPIRSHIIQKFTSNSSIIPSSAICTNVTLSFHLMLSHASVGHKALPQSKIVGAHIVHINSDYFFLCVGLRSCKSGIHYVNVRFVVTFVNVTKL